MSEELEPLLYDQIGGESGIASLVDAFYRIMSEVPEMSLIRNMHTEDLSHARLRLFSFLSGWTGGPQLYLEKFGHPKLRFKHLPFSIGKQERDLWLQCMLSAIEEVGIEEQLKYFLMDAFLKIADHMRNRPETDLNS